MELEIRRKGKPRKTVQNNEWVWNEDLWRQGRGRDAVREKEREQSTAIANRLPLTEFSR